MTTKATLRPLQGEDRAELERVTRAVGVFKEYEIPVALEVFDAALRPGQEDYESLAAEVEGRFAGWAAWGRRPCTEGTWDLYWIAVDPALHGAGVGTAMLEELERRIMAAEERIRALEAAFAESKVYLDPEAVKRNRSELEAAKGELAGLEEEYGRR